jgi:plasmid stabilization system protein ParE
LSEVIWSPQSKRSQAKIYRYIARDNPVAAFDVGRRILDAGNGLGIYPTGRKGRVKGTYVKSLPNLPYILVYRIDRRRDRIQILDIVHTRRDRLPGLT